MIRRVANDHVELHIASKQLGKPSLDVVGVNERIGVGFEVFATIERLLAGAAISAVFTFPGVLGAFEPDVPIIAGERLGDGVLAFGVLRAIHAPPRKQTREIA